MMEPAAVRITPVCIALLGLAACSGDTVTPAVVAAETAVAGGCMAGGEGRMEASVRGALEADINWSNAQMVCDGGLRPDGRGVRITMAGPLDATRQLRFILGIDLEDAAAGPAQVLPTNLTLIVEGESLLYATRGDDKCAVEDLERTPVSDGVERISGRGYCLGPASDLVGATRVLVPTFSFTAMALTGSQEDMPAP
jgi:hypothetical protein